MSDRSTASRYGPLWYTARPDHPVQNSSVAERACSGSTCDISGSWLGAHDMTNEIRSLLRTVKSASVSRWLPRIGTGDVSRTRSGPAIAWTWVPRYRTHGTTRP